MNRKWIRLRYNKRDHYCVSCGSNGGVCLDWEISFYIEMNGYFEFTRIYKFIRSRCVGGIVLAKNLFIYSQLHQNAVNYIQNGLNQYGIITIYYTYLLAMHTQNNNVIHQIVFFFFQEFTDREDKYILF